MERGGEKKREGRWEERVELGWDWEVNGCFGTGVYYVANFGVIAGCIGECSNLMSSTVWDL